MNEWWKDQSPRPEDIGEMFSNWAKLAQILEKEMSWWDGTIEWELVSVSGTCSVRGNPGGEYRLETVAQVSIRYSEKPTDIISEGTTIPFRDNWGHGQESDERAMQQVAFALKKRHAEIMAYIESHPR